MPAVIIAVFVLCMNAAAHAQTRRNIKVVLETKQSGTSDGLVMQGSGGVIVRRGTAQPSPTVRLLRGNPAESSRWCWMAANPF
jgi:hypothetical protein